MKTRTKWKRWSKMSREEKLRHFLWVHGSVHLRPGAASRLSRWYQKTILQEGL